MARVGRVPVSLGKFFSFNFHVKIFLGRVVVVVVEEWGQWGNWMRGGGRVGACDHKEPHPDPPPWHTHPFSPSPHKKKIG
jgi:hypothetical protein